MDPNKEFEAEVKENLRRLGEDKDLQALSRIWKREVVPYKYAYNFRWLGRPIIQEPQDIVAIQELIWQVRPDLVLDCGIARGGSLVLNASILAMLELEEAVCSGSSYSPSESKRMVLGVDIDIRAHNRAAIEAHFLSSKIKMIQGSSIDREVIRQVKEYASSFSRIMVCLDSNHTHEHVLAELEAYAPLVARGSYCIVFDTGIEDIPSHLLKHDHWGKGNNPKTAVFEYLKRNSDFEIDKEIEHKILITAASDGFLRRIQ